MSKLRRIFTILTSLVMIGIGIIVILLPSEQCFYIIAIIIGVFISIKAIKDFIYYLTSARHMIGGKKILINSLVELDFGLLSFLIILKRPIIALAYLVVMFMALGAIDILRALEIKNNEGKRWQLKLIKGGIAIALGIACLIIGIISMVNDKEAKSLIDIVTSIFAIAWIVQGVFGIILSFHKTSIVYVDEQTTIL